VPGHEAEFERAADSLVRWNRERQQADREEKDSA
jgi:hypothetical protein